MKERFRGAKFPSFYQKTNIYNMNYEITEQQVFDLASGRSKVNEMFPDVFKVTELKENNWYTTEKGSLVNYQGGDSGYGLNQDGEWFSNSDWGFGFVTWSNADPKLVAESLTQQCLNRFGVNWEDAQIEEVEKRLYGHDISTNSGFYKTRFLNNNTEIWSKNGCLLSNGVWSEPLKVKISHQRALEIIAEQYKTVPNNIIIEL